MQKLINGDCLISIHAPHAGSDKDRADANAIFIKNFNPRSPCGERHRIFSHGCSQAGISIHAPHAGSDLRVRVLEPDELEFQSTLPMRGATCLCRPKGETHRISIHAPHAGSDAHRFSFIQV